jgi:hypothetical protein
MEPADFMGGLDHGSRPTRLSLIFLSIWRGKKVNDNPGSHHTGVDCAFTAATWKLRSYARYRGPYEYGLLQRTRLHDAERTD